MAARSALRGGAGRGFSRRSAEERRGDRRGIRLLTPRASALSVINSLRYSCPLTATDRELVRATPRAEIRDAASGWVFGLFVALFGLFGALGYLRHRAVGEV